MVSFPILLGTIPLQEAIPGLSTAYDTQFGGLPNRSADMAIILLRRFSDYCKAKGWSEYRLFTDVKAAFCSVIRALALPMPLSDVAIAKLLQTLDFPP